MDTGPAVQGRHIDIYMWNCDEARYEFGRRSAGITVLRLGWNPLASTPRLVDRCPQREGAQPAVIGRLRLRCGVAPSSTGGAERLAASRLLSPVLQLVDVVRFPLRRRSDAARLGTCPLSLREVVMSGSSRACAMQSCVAPPSARHDRDQRAVSVSTVEVASSRQGPRVESEGRATTAAASGEPITSRLALDLARVADGTADEPAGMHASAARFHRRSVMDNSPSLMFSAMVPENRCTSWRTRLKRRRSSRRSNSRTSRPSMRIRPRVTS